MKDFSDKNGYLKGEEKKIVDKHTSLLNKAIGMIEDAMGNLSLDNPSFIDLFYQNELVTYKNAKTFEKEYREMIVRCGSNIKMNGSLIKSIEKIDY
ncbi:hypothetical protein CO037_00335 [Candidatus Pacearchaeota archaeon CG_4_9_14_0_2_um_filter_30_8]|nr:MAG: hypothetical protein CO037_00335 [Candidatus Pacearchaeota archaeon CG_4_9_14_0_2_um_filter_30_8]